MNTKIAIVGASGRMGQELLRNAAALSAVTVTGALVAGDDAGNLLGPQGVVGSVDIDGKIAEADVVIDFSTPQACVTALKAAVAHRKPIVSGTTGLSDAQQAQVSEASKRIPVLQAANFSVGVNVLEHLVELASRAGSEGFDIEIFEAHHRHKVDAPSGTALYLGEAAARGRGWDLDEVATHARHGHTGERADAEIGFQVVRGGSIVGEHTVFLCGDGERLELTHRATDRGIFARGALRAALWLVEQEPGFYSMKDVLFS